MKHEASSRYAALLTALIAGAAGCGGSDSKSNVSDDTPSMDAAVHHDDHPAPAREAGVAHRADTDAGHDSGAGAIGASMDASLDGSAGIDGEDNDGGEEADAFVPTCSAVTLTFKGTVTTVADTPLGLDSSVRTTDVSGSFAYFPCYPDQDSDPQRGIYDPASGAFSLRVGGLSIAGSGRPRIEVENFDPDTFRWRDGKIPLNAISRVMTVDGKPSPSLEVLIAITDGSGAAFASDVPPASFPFLDIASYPHTFSVQDQNGTLLLQLSSLKQQ